MDKLRALRREWPLALTIATFSSSRINVLLGAVHLLLFFAYLMLIFQR